MKKYFLTGLIILLPFLLTVMIILYLFDIFTGPFVGLVEGLIISYEEKRGIILSNRDVFVQLISRVTVFIFLLFFIYGLGFFARKYFFNLLLSLTNKLFSKVPLVRSIYRVSRDLTKAVFTQDSKTFKETVVVPFPGHDTHALAFVTGPVPDAIRKVIPDAELTVFVPTSPHPISGFLLLSPKKFVHQVDVSTEDGFKFLLSAGIMTPPTSTSTEPPSTPESKNLF